jgi:hypothetical protein
MYIYVDFSTESGSLFFQLLICMGSCESENILQDKTKLLRQYRGKSS